MPALDTGPSTVCERLLDDAAMIARVNRGDQDAACALVARLRPTVLKCVRRRLPRWASEEDLVQTAFGKIFSKLDQFNPMLGEFGGWTSRIMTNECILIIRKNQKKMITQELSNDLPVFYREESALDKISREDIMKIIQKLPTGYRIIFNMYVFEGYSHKEIAEQLEISEGTSKSQLFKARKMLQEALEVII